MAYKQGVEGFVRVPTSQDPNKVYATGVGGRPMDNPEMLMEYTGETTPEAAFQHVQSMGEEAARGLGIRLPGTEKLFPEQPEVLTPDMLGQNQLKIPDNDTSNIGADAIDKAGGLSSQGEYWKQQAELANKQYEDATKRQEDLMKQLEGSQASAQDFLSQQQEQYKIQEQFNQITNLITEASDISENVNNLIAQRDASLLSQEGIPGLTVSEVTGRKAVIERQANSRIAAESARLSSKQATIQAIQGNVSMARSFINDAVSAMTFDQQQEVNLLTKFIDINRDTINSLDTKYQNAIQGAMDTANAELSIAREDAQAKMDLVLRAGERGVKLDVDGMTLQQAYDAYNEAVAPLVAEERAADLDRTRQLTAGETEEEEITGLEGALNEAAQDVIAMERDNASSNEAYFQIVDELATDSGIPRESIDKMLIGAIRRIKGEAGTTQEIEENIGSDFITTPEERLMGVSEEGKREESAREKARQEAISKGLKMFLDPTTGEMTSV